MPYMTRSASRLSGGPEDHPELPVRTRTPRNRKSSSKASSAASPTSDSSSSPKQSPPREVSSLSPRRTRASSLKSSPPKSPKSPKSKNGKRAGNGTVDLTGKLENLKEEAFTPAPKNRPLQAMFLAIVLIPQIMTYLCSKQEDYTEAWNLFFKPLFSLGNWQSWLHSDGFLVVVACLAIERICYTIVWLFPQHFYHFAENGPLQDITVRIFGKGRPLDVILFLFYVSKVFQFGSLIGWYLAVGNFVDLRQISPVRWITGIQLLGIGQMLNIAIYNAIGKAGVYYGFKLGEPVPWCTGFPFNVFTMHPQYAGSVMTILGAGELLMTKNHSEKGGPGLLLIAMLYYVYMAIVEDIPAEHPLDSNPRDRNLRATPQVKLRDLRTLSWSKIHSKDYDTSANLRGFLARPWVPMVLATLAFFNTFVMVLPVAILFFLLTFRDSYSLLPNAWTVSGGYMFGVAVFILLLDLGYKLEDIPFLRMTDAKLQEGFPNQFLLASKEHSYPGVLVAFIIAQPVGALWFALKAELNQIAVILLSGVGTFVSLAAIGALAAIVKALLKRAYDYWFDEYDPVPDEDAAQEEEAEEDEEDESWMR